MRPRIIWPIPPQDETDGPRAPMYGETSGRIFWVIVFDTGPPVRPALPAIFATEYA